MSERVVLYSTDCPKCKVLKQKLNNKGVTYKENNSVDDMLKLGIMEVPVLMVNGERMNFTQALSWLKQK